MTYASGSGGPAGGTYSFGFDAMGRPTSMSDGVSSIVSAVTYGPAGELLTMTGQYAETRTYNSRLQLTSLNSVTFTYAVSPANNGKIATQSDSVSGETISYQYDSLQRLISASSRQGWGQGFNYDGFGNLTGKTVLAGSAPTFSAAFDPLTSRQVGISYDANGNQLTDMGGYGSLTYDVENRLKWAQNGNTTRLNTFGYDPDNRRVYKSVMDADTNHIWNLSSGEVAYFGTGGQKIGTYTLQVQTDGLYLTATGYNLYFGSKLVKKINSDGGGGMVQPDRLGSVGKFYPYGEDRPGNPAANNTEKFCDVLSGSGFGVRLCDEPIL